MEWRRLWVEASQDERAQWQALLEEAHLTLGEAVDAVYGLFDGDRLIATGATLGNIMKYLVVAPDYRGGRVFHQLISALTHQLYQQGYTKIFVYTTPHQRQRFEALHFEVLAQTESVCFLEKGTVGFADYLAAIQATEQLNGTVGAIVMNANPFTLGHRYLVESALKQCDALYLFVVSTDCSLFTTAERVALVRRGVADLPNVHVYETNAYMVSLATFPGYFLPFKCEEARIDAQAHLDATLFAERIAPALHIERRFVGEEPYSEITARYNHQLAVTLKDRLELIIIPRKTDTNQHPISASRVRQAIASGDWAAILDWVPQSTATYIQKHCQGLQQRQQEMKGQHG